MANKYPEKIASFIRIRQMVEQSGNLEASNILGKIIAAKLAPTAGKRYGKRSMRIGNDLAVAENREDRG